MGDNEGSARQKKSILDIYHTIGKVINQMLREGLPMNECFSSPLLLSYLLRGRDGLGTSNLSHSELMRGILDHDSGYTGVYMYMHMYVCVCMCVRVCVCVHVRNFISIDVCKYVCVRI